jgi:hypothetical protein
MQNTNNSLLFMLTLRRSLCEFLNTSDLNNKERGIASHYIMTESSDYEIMTFIMTGDFPKDKSNTSKLQDLFETFKISLIRDFRSIIPYTSEDHFESILFEVSPLNTSSNILLKSFLNEQDDKKNVTKLAIPAMAGGFFGSIGKSTFDSGKELAKKGVGPLFSYLKTSNGKKIGAGVVASLIIYASVLAYKKYFSKIGIECKNYKGEEKRNCIKKFKTNAIKNQIYMLKQGLGACRNKKNEQRCVAAIKSKIEKLSIKLKSI